MILCLGKNIKASETNVLKSPLLQKVYLLRPTKPKRQKVEEERPIVKVYQPYIEEITDKIVKALRRYKIEKTLSAHMKIKNIYLVKNR